MIDKRFGTSARPANSSIRWSNSSIQRSTDFRAAMFMRRAWPLPYLLFVLHGGRNRIERRQHLLLISGAAAGNSVLNRSSLVVVVPSVEHDERGRIIGRDIFAP